MLRKINDKKAGFTPLEIQKSKTKLRLPKGNLSLTGFTLMEVIIAAVILTLTILTSASIFIHLLSLVEEYRDPDTLIFAPQQYAAQEEMENISGMNYIDIKNNYTNNGALKRTSMSITNNLNRSGIIYAQELATDGLLRIKVVVCYLQRNRIIGEDANFNGVLDMAEDANGNGELDSPCQIETVVANRG
jgi:Tfp pilus assembly protein PilV